MANPNDFNTTIRRVCVACFALDGSLVDMQDLDTVPPATKAKCPTCEGTNSFIVYEDERKAS